MWKCKNFIFQIAMFNPFCHILSLENIPPWFTNLYQRDSHISAQKIGSYSLNTGIFHCRLNAASIQVRFVSLMKCRHWPESEGQWSPLCSHSPFIFGQRPTQLIISAHFMSWPCHPCPELSSVDRCLHVGFSVTCFGFLSFWLWA